MPLDLVAIVGDQLPAGPRCFVAATEHNRGESHRVRVVYSHRVGRDPRNCASIAVCRSIDDGSKYFEVTIPGVVRLDSIGVVTNPGPFRMFGPRWRFINGEEA